MPSQTLHPSPERRSRPGLRHWVLETFWLTDLMVIALLVFFLLLGAFSPFESEAVAIGMGVLIVLYAGHAVIRWRNREREALSPEDRRARERRGF